MTNKTEWTYCPECGCEDIRHEEGEHKQCASCHQEWFSSVDYSDVVRKHLSGKYIDKDAEIERLRGELGECKGEYDRAVNKVDALRDQLAEAHSLFADVLSIDVPRTAQSLERMRSILSASAEPKNQCDGCRAGIPLINGMHRMGKPGEYPDLMACTSKRYDYDPDEPANKEGAQ